MQIWDSHIHLDQYPKDRIPYFIERWLRNGVEGIIAVSMDLKSSYKLLEYQLIYGDFIHVALGYHPEQHLPKDSDLLELTNLIHAERNRIIGIGEVGLIHYRKKELNIVDTTGYNELFQHFVSLSKKLDKPIIVHAVHQEASTALKILTRSRVKKAQFHWFKSDDTTIKAIDEAGYYISFTPELTFKERDKNIFKRFSLSRILLESDGPYPLEGKYVNRLNEPLWIKDSIITISELTGLIEEQVSNIMLQNTKTFFFEDNPMEI